MSQRSYLHKLTVSANQCPPSQQIQIVEYSYQNRQVCPKETKTDHRLNHHSAVKTHEYYIFHLYRDNWRNYSILVLMVINCKVWKISRLFSFFYNDLGYFYNEKVDFSLNFSGTTAWSFVLEKISLLTLPSSSFVVSFLCIFFCFTFVVKEIAKEPLIITQPHSFMYDLLHKIWKIKVSSHFNQTSKGHF